MYLIIRRCSLLAYLFLSAVLTSLSYATAVDLQQRAITLALAEEPPDLNSLTSTDSVSFFVLGHVSEGLLQYDQYNQLAPAVAERWQLDEQGAVFYLRRDAKWSDGTPVTAHDFVFAWQKVVDPAIGSQYASILYPVKHAEAINQGKLPIEELGVIALDDTTLKVTFEKPTSYFLSLTAFASYYPVRENFYQQSGATYAAEHHKLLYNGPFIITQWVHGASMVLEKNPHYWNKQKIQLNKIKIPYITSDPLARFNLFKDNSIALVGLDSDTLKDALHQQVRIKRFLDGVLLYLEFNHQANKPTANRNLRKAIQRVLNSDELVNKIIGIPGNIPGESLFPKWLNGVEKKFRQEYPADVVKRDYLLAKDYLQRAKQEMQVEQIRPLVLLTGDSPGAAREAEYFQRVLKQHLGLELKIDKQIFKQRLAKMTSGEFDIVSAGWGPDFDDPITFGNLFASWNENNRGRYRHQDYDHWVRIAESTADQPTRMAAMARLQQILIDDAAIIPLYERGSVYVQHPQLKGVVRRIFGGDPYYGFSYLKN